MPVSDTTESWGAGWGIVKCCSITTGLALPYPLGAQQVLDWVSGLVINAQEGYPKTAAF